MSHIHTQPGQHDTTASAFIVRLSNTAQPSLILHKHRKLNQWLQFGGHVELNENPWSAVVHEIAEESGYAMRQLKVLQPSMRLTKISDAVLHPYPLTVLTCRFGETDHYHTDIAYAFVTHELPEEKLGEGESAEIRAFTTAELAAIPRGEIPENVREIGLFTLENCLIEWSRNDTSDFQTSILSST